jgi:ABC-type multidrug transport system fused ATPase/permease subunit
VNRELLRQVKPARIFLLWAVVFGMLSAGATIAQMVFLSKIIDWGFLAEGPEQMEPLLQRKEGETIYGAD